MAAAVVHPMLAKAGFERAIKPLLTGWEQYAKLGVRPIAYSFPFLDLELNWPAHGRKIMLRIDGTDYPYRPVSGWWIAPNHMRLVPGRNEVPVGNGFHANDQEGSPRPWFCFAGWKEFHDHVSHQDVPWSSIRREPGFAVPQLILQLQRDLNKPGVSTQ